MFTLLVPAMAVEVEQQRENEETITVMSDGHGQYSLLQDRDDRMQGTLSINQEVISAYATEDAGIYYVNGDKYLANVAEDTYIMLKRIPLNVENDVDRDIIFQTYHVDDEMKNDIASIIESQKMVNNTEFTIDILVPDVVASSSSTSTPDPVYYTYNGNKMLDKFIKTSHLSVGTGEITGKNVKNLMSQLKNLVLSVGGTVVPAVGLFGAFDSALAFYEATKAPVAYGSASDRTYTNISYDKLIKSTYVGIGSSYIIGCKSQKVWLDTNFTYQYYQAIGQHYHGEVYLNQVRYTPSYNNAAAVALKSASSATIDASIKTMIHGVTCVF